MSLLRWHLRGSHFWDQVSRFGMLSFTPSKTNLMTKITSLFSFRSFFFFFPFSSFFCLRQWAHIWLYHVVYKYSFFQWKFIYTCMEKQERDEVRDWASHVCAVRLVQTVSLMQKSLGEDVIRIHFMRLVVTMLIPESADDFHPVSFWIIWFRQHTAFTDWQQDQLNRWAEG